MWKNNTIVLVLFTLILISIFPAIGVASSEDTSIDNDTSYMLESSDGEREKSTEKTNTGTKIDDLDIKSGNKLENKNLPPAPTPPRNNSKNTTDGEDVLSYNAQNDTVTRRNTSDLTVFGTASVNGSAESTPGFHPMDRSTSPDGDRVQIDNTQNFPWRPIVQLRIDGPDADTEYDTACSGTLISDNQVLTAAHCVYFYDDQGNPEGYVDSVTAVPGANSAATDPEPFGKARMKYIKTYTGWTDYQDYDYDLALITLDRDIGVLTGWFGYATFSTDSSAYTSNFHATGYPGNPPSSSYPTMWDHYDSGAGTSSCNANNCLTHEYWMITTNGQSGGPVWKQDSFDNGNRHILSVISGGFSDDPTRPNVGTRITNKRYEDIGSWITETDNQVSVNNRPELADTGSDSRNYHPDSIVVGENTLNIEQKVVNKGPQEAGCFDVTFYLSADPQVATTYNRLGDSTICSLSPAEEMTAEWSGIVPADVPSGEYVVVSSIDQEDRVSEYDEYPNVNTFDQTLTVQSSTSFNVEITSTNSPVVAGDSLNVTANVENTGGGSGVKNIKLSVPDVGNDSTSVSLSRGESQNTTLSVSTSEGDNGNPTAEVSTPDDSDTQSVWITERLDSNFDVSIQSTNAPITAGETLEVTATVTNTGDEIGGAAERIKLTVPTVGSNSTNLILANGESQDTTLSLDTSKGDGGNLTIEISSLNDSATQEVMINEQSGAVEITNVSFTPTKISGDPVSEHDITVEISNLSADGSDDEFEVVFPEGIEVTGAEYNLREVHDVETNNRTLSFSVNPLGGGTTNESYTLSNVTILTDSRYDS